MTSTAADLQAIGWPLRPDGRPTVEAWHALMDAHPGTWPARIVEQHRSGYQIAVDASGETYSVESLPEWQRPANVRKGGVDPEQRPAVGDWVLVEGALASGKVAALLPRRTSIKRGAAGEHYRQQLIAANVDTVFVVCGLDADFNPRRIERYLLLVRGGAEPVVVLTKADLALAEGADALPGAVAALAELAEQGVAVRTVNARDADSVATLNPWLGPGRTVVLVGSSGAGKSTLTNSLLGIERMKTGEVRGSDSRGRHTTTHRALIPLPSGACMIDTPGMRELKPTGEEDVAESFGDVEALAAQCRFRDCVHDREPGCAVQAAIKAGTLDPQRYANYRKLGDEVAGAAGRLAQRRAEAADDKSQSRTSGARPSDRHGKR
ncbi:ribosome small subunit-dependent GTPase A [Lysobacter sp. A3-1-A15]|uniref:ribosome small subunit-dependent GTPase A n=1 Tax=Novilysobacter viscosus TaxID=3098602 RepID=UPI002ED982DE